MKLPVINLNILCDEWRDLSSTQGPANEGEAL